MRRGLLALPAAVAIVAAALPVAAHPVRIGRYAEIPYGVRQDHPFAGVRGDARSTGRVRGVAPRREPVLRWERALRHRRPRGPTVSADGTLFVGTLGGLTALGPDGTERWFAPLGPLHAAPSLMPGGDLLVVTRAGLVVQLSPEGMTRRSVELGVPTHGMPLVLDDGSFAIGTLDRRLHRLDSGLRRVFDTELPEPAAAILSRLPRELLAVPSGHSLRLLDREGRVARNVPLGNRPTSPALVADDGTVWVIAEPGIALAIESSGRVRSRTELGSRHYEGAAPAVGRDGALRVPTLTRGLVCIGPAGSERWTVSSSAGHQAPVNLDDEDTALLVDRAGRMFAIGADGALRWQVTLETYSYEAPVLGPDGTLYVTTERGVLQAWAAP